MKLVTYTPSSDPVSPPRVGAVIADHVVDAGSEYQGISGMQQFLAAGDPAHLALQQRSEQAVDKLPLTAVNLLAPVLRPSKFFGVSLNYIDHIRETGLDTPDYPTFFNKQSTCVIGPYAPIYRPSVSNKLDYEGELAVVIGKRCRNISKSQAAEVICGYTIVNDVSVRDWQMRSHTWTLGKSFDTHGPMGPWIVTSDEITDPHQLDLKTWVNGQERQSSNTRQLIFDCYHLVHYLAQVMTLLPGDVIATGTCGGVGVKMTPRGYMQPGDVVRIAIEQIGVLENPVMQEPEDYHFID